MESSLLLVKPKFLPRFVRASPQIQVVRITQWRKPYPKFLNIGSSQRMDTYQSCEVKMLQRLASSHLNVVNIKTYIIEADNVSDFIVLVQSSCCVGDCML
jgi:hypothetical protein